MRALITRTFKLFLITAFFYGVALAETTETVMNPFTSNLDYIADLDNLTGNIKTTGSATFATVCLESGTYDTYLSGGTPTASVYYKFPVTDGSGGEYLSTNGNGSLSWGTPAGSGDMEKATYDTDTNNIVDNAEEVGTLGTTGLVKRSGAETYSTITDSSANWNTAFGWGDHSVAGYLTEQAAEEDTLYSVSQRENIAGTILISSGITVGSTVWNTGDSIDGEQIANDTIDDDSIDFGSGDAVDTDDLPEGSTNLYSTLTNIQTACSNDFHNIGGVDATGTSAEEDTLYSVVSRESIAGTDISATSITVTTATAVVVDTQYLENSSGDLVVRDNTLFYNYSSDDGVVITQSTKRGSGKDTVLIYDNTGNTINGSYVLQIHQDNPNGDEEAVYINNDSTGSALLINQESGAGAGLIVESSADRTGYPLVWLNNTTNADSDIKPILEITASGNADGIYISQGEVLSANYASLRIKTTEPQVNAPLMFIENDDTGSTYDMVQFTTDGSGDALDVTGKTALHGTAIIDEGATAATVCLESGTYDTYLDGGTPTATVYYKLPPADGSANEVLHTDGNGTLSWDTDGGGDWTDEGSYLRPTDGDEYVACSDTGTRNFVGGDGDLYVEDDAEIDGTLNVNDIDMTNASTDHAININQSGALASGKHALNIYSTTTQDTSTMVLFNQNNVDSSQPVFDVDNAGDGDYITADNTASLSNAGVWTDAVSTLSEKDNVTEITLFSGFVDKLKSLKMYQYQKKREVYGAKQEILENGKLVKKYPDVKKRPDARYYKGYILDDPSTPEELIARNYDGDIVGVSPADGVNFLLGVNKELINKIEDLEARIETLEGN